MDSRARWKDVYNRFDPEDVATERAWRVDRTQSPFQTIIESLDLKNDESRVLLLGTVGSGKSTELLRVADARTNDEFVVLLDLARHFNYVVNDPAALLTVAAWEVCFLVGVALIHQARERLQLEVARETVRDLEDAWRELAAASHTETTGEVDVVGLGRSLVVAGGAVLAAATGVVSPTTIGVGKMLLDSAKEASTGSKWKLSFGRSTKAVPDQDERLRSMLATVNRVIAEVQERERRVLLVLDGLDRIVDIEHARALFVDSSVLGRLQCSLVLAGPFALRHRMDVARVRHFKSVTLVNEPVLDHTNPAGTGPGVAVMREIFRRRVRDIEGVSLTDAQVDRLAYFSGGRARDFVRLLRGVAAKTIVRKLDGPGDREVDDALDEMRRLYETGLTREHAAVLESVAEDPEHALPDDERAWELLQQDRLLPYPNRSEWFFPHPLLTLYKVTRWKSGSPP